MTFVTPIRSPVVRPGSCSMLKAMRAFSMSSSRLSSRSSESVARLTFVSLPLRHLTVNSSSFASASVARIWTISSLAFGDEEVDDGERLAAAAAVFFGEAILRA